MDEKLMRVLYVSRSTIPPVNATSSVKAIVNLALKKNDSLSITGGLVFTGQYFAQLLEGSPEGVDALMASIERDSRHRDVRVIARDPVSKRRFPTWSLAYAGPSRFVTGYIARQIEIGASTSPMRDAAWLIEIMEEFANIRSTLTR